MNMTIEQILKESPIVKGRDDKKWAFYSVGCCWWTSFPEDLGNTQDFMPMKKMKYFTTGADGKRQEHEADFNGLPCCPHCGSVLMQAPLEDFVKSAQENPAHYGPLGIDVFTMSHERNVKACFRKWDAYEIFIKPFRKDGV